jgi:outer membrane protein assembly factor BamD
MYYIKGKGSLVLVLILSVMIGLGSCRSNYQKVLKGNDIQKKYELAKVYYNKKDYFRALELLEELVNVYRGTEQAEDIYYYYAYCHYGLKDLITARYHFKTFAETYPRSTRAEECRYMSAYCYYLDSPEYTLDQENTYKAIESLQLFINLYPTSTRVAECNELIDKLRNKLQSKSYINAKLYYNIGDYKSAIYAFRNSIDDFPDTSYKEEMEFLTIKSSFLYAKNSIESKKAERYLETIDYYQNFVDSYGSSKFIKEAQTFYDNSRKELEQLNKSANTSKND